MNPCNRPPRAGLAWKQVYAPGSSILTTVADIDADHAAHVRAHDEMLREMNATVFGKAPPPVPSLWFRMRSWLDRFL